MTILKISLIVLTLLLAGPAIAMVSGIARFDREWYTANRESAGIAPDPAEAREPIVQVYAARAFGWRAAFAVHTWIAVKRADAATFTNYEVIGWRLHRGQPPLVAHQGPADRRWYGSEPEILVDLRGPEVETVIDRIEQAVASYPFGEQYRVWPGPNSNSFTAWVGRAVPELRLDLPPTAVGKDYLGPSTFLAPSPSGTGYQLSLFGLVGLLAGLEEGLEINVLGLSAGIDPLDLKLRLPGLGRVPG